MAEDESKEKTASNLIAKYSRNSSHPDGQCGCGRRCSPSWLQRIRNPLIIVFFIWAVGIIVYINNTYFGATLSTIERRFGLSNSESAFLAAINDLSKTLVVVFISFIADRTSRPVWLMISVLVMGIGNFMTALPHFFSDPLDLDALLEGRRSTFNTNWTDNLCTIGSEFNSSGVNDGTCMEESVGFRGVFWWAIVGQIVFGIGQAAFTPVVIPYLDDLAGRNRRIFVLYYAFYSTVWIVGPSLGYFIGSSILQYYVDFERIPGEEIPTEISQRDPRWIGAWWVGFVATACYLLLGAIPMSLLPRDPSVNVCVTHTAKEDRGVITKNDSFEMTELLSEKEQSEKQQRDSFLTIVKDFLPVVKRILRRPVLVFVMLFMTVELACIGVFTSFTIKYFQFQFGVSPQRAAFVNGAVLLPAALLGVSVSAFVCRHFKLTLKQCGKYLIGNNAITVIVLLVAMFIGCKNPVVAGVNEKYSTISNGLDNVSCNTDCECDDNIFRPVCGSDGISYLSPCHAGCQTTEATNGSVLSRYTNCTCTSPSSAEGNTNSSIPGIDEFGSAKPGLCEREESCDQLFIYLFILFGVLAFCRSQDNAPMNLIVLGNSENEIRTTVYGLSSFVCTILGFFPTPIYFGVIVNITCSLWQYACGERAACWLYDIDKLRYAYFGINIALRLLQIPVCIGIFLTTKTEAGDSETRKVDDATEKQ